MYSSEKVIYKNNTERAKQKILKAVMSKFGLNDPDGTTIDKITFNLTYLASYHKLIGTIVPVKAAYENKGI
jgi:hypothetical protein